MGVNVYPPQTSVTFSGAQPVYLANNSGQIRPLVLGSSNQVYHLKGADKFAHTEYGNLQANGAFATVYTVSDNALKASLHSVIVEGTHSGGLHELRFKSEDGTQTTTILKFQGGLEKVMIDFKGAVTSPYLGGTIEMVNNSNQNSTIEFTATLAEV